MNRIKVRRLSAMPNARGSFAYALEQEVDKTIAGVYETPNGNVIYSRARLGVYNKPMTVECRIQKSRQANDDRQFINLIDPTAELAGSLGAKVALAERSGFGAAAQAKAAEIFFGGAVIQQAAPTGGGESGGSGNSELEAKQQAWDTAHDELSHALALEEGKEEADQNADEIQKIKDEMTQLGARPV